MFSMVTVALSTSNPIASANPPSVIKLMEFPVRNSPTSPAKIDSGMEAETTTVFRQLPRKIRMSAETSTDDRMASWITFSTAPRTNTDWSKSSFTSNPSGAAALMKGSASRAASTTARVEASACFKIAR